MLKEPSTERTDLNSSDSRQIYFIVWSECNGCEFNKENVTLRQFNEICEAALHVSTGKQNPDVAGCNYTYVPAYAHKALWSHVQ